MTGDKLEKDKQSAKSWYWWGIPTFFRCDWDEDPAACDIALVGVPHSSGNGSTERDQHLGPAGGAQCFWVLPAGPCHP